MRKILFLFVMVMIIFIPLSRATNITSSTLSEKVFERTFGFSLLKVIVNVTGPCINPIEKTVKGIIFLRFIRLRRFL